MTTGPAATPRCAAHPGRPAHGSCPRCRRPRCDLDAARFAATGCPACWSADHRTERVGRLEVAVRAGLAGLPVAWIGGWIATQYVGVHLFSLVMPGLVGLSAWLAVNRATRLFAGSQRLFPAGAAVVIGLLGTALGFRLVPGGQDLLHPAGVVVAPYACAVFGVLAGVALFAPPAASDAGQDGSGTTLN